MLNIHMDLDLEYGFMSSLFQLLSFSNCDIICHTSFFNLLKLIISTFVDL